MQLPVWLFWILGVLLITWFIAGDDPLSDDREQEGFYLLWYDASMNNSINVNGVSFRLLEDGSLLLTTPTGQGGFWMHRPIYLRGRDNMPQTVSFWDMSKLMRNHHDR
jgi:hypothetical protein